MFESINIERFTTVSGVVYKNIPLSYSVFGRALHSAPIICVNHALTGNANVCGDQGWWRDLIGGNKVINTNEYTVLAFNIPGNGQDGFVIENYHDFIAKDVAILFLKGLKQLKVNQLKALIGGSLGGGLAWEMAALAPHLCEHVIVVASDYQASDWLIANCHLQEQILLNSSQPVHDARKHAMLCYRTPVSFKHRFNRAKQNGTNLFQVEDWLNHHGATLDQRFQLPAYLLMNQLLKTIDVDFGRQPQLLAKITAKIHIIAIDSDLFFPASSSRLGQQKLAQMHPSVSYHEITSHHGHDAFLLEHDQLAAIITPILSVDSKSVQTKVIKFGGRSLSDELNGLNEVIRIINALKQQNDRLVVVLSARGDTTQKLKRLMNLAAEGQDYLSALKELIDYQYPTHAKCPVKIDFSAEEALLNKRLKGIELIGDYSLRTSDEILAQGELMTVKVMQHLLSSQGIHTVDLLTQFNLVTDDEFGQAQPIDSISRKNVLNQLAQNPEALIYLAAGFVGINQSGEVTTLGANGSNFTATLLANYLAADVVLNYTHVNGLHTANPDWVETAQSIRALSFAEANELAQLGTEILHAKTLIPIIEKNIPLRLLNTFDKCEAGTLISADANSKGLKCVSTNDEVSLINLEGRGLLGKPGIDARIFNVLANNRISVNMVSQSSAERSIGLVVPRGLGLQAQKVLRLEFNTELINLDVTSIELFDEVTVVSAVGLSLEMLNRPLEALIRNRIKPKLINNSLNGKNVSLLIDRDKKIKAVRVIHEAVFGSIKRIHLVVFGHGLVGKTFINQVFEIEHQLLSESAVKLKIISVSNSRHQVRNIHGIKDDWQQLITDSEINAGADDLIKWVKQHDLENVIVVDNTASYDLVAWYSKFVAAGFDLVSSNKIANTLSLDFYHQLRADLTRYRKSYLYETNVGAGLPLIDTISSLHRSGERITAIRGVFSGSLSYIFNRFSSENISFSEVIKAAMESGYTEPDPRVDLSGTDVARKLLILARELDYELELEDVEVNGLIPTELKELSRLQFMTDISRLDAAYAQSKASLDKNHVLRYVGELNSCSTQPRDASLKVSLQTVKKSSPLGGLGGSDSLFEIYTDSYGRRPIVIQGAGAGADVTARGVLGDVLKVVRRNQ